MTVSIAMATYNGAKHLQEQLASFLAQSRLPDELVVCDDGSTDDTLEIIGAFKASCPFLVRVFHNKSNLGYPYNFEKAISLCEGEVIFLSDQDDVWFAEKVSVVTDAFQKNPDLLVIGNDQVLVDSEMHSSGLTLIGQMVSSSVSVEKNYVSGCGTAIRKAFKEIAFPIPSISKEEDRWIHDHDCWIHHLGYYLGRRKILYQSLQYYRRHGANVTGSYLVGLVPTHWFSMFRQVAANDPRPSFRTEIIRLRQLRGRLFELSKNASLATVSHQELVASISNLEREEVAWSRRVSALGLHRLRRPISVLLNWIRGDYDFFAGIKSAVWDLIR